MKQNKTSWQPVSRWYSDITKDKGHYFHEHVIIPKVVKLLQLKDSNSLLDLACGAGILGRSVGKHIRYTGIDIAPSLIESARRQDKSSVHTYVVQDITKPLEIPKSTSVDNSGRTQHVQDDNGKQLFTHAACILAIQNVKEPEMVFRHVSTWLVKEGTFVIVMNHPAFRIPRQTSWGIDEQSKIQYRRVNRYMSPLEIPVTMHPGAKQKSPVTWSYHFPLSTYVQWLVNAGFVITGLEEWTSDKESVGKNGKMENTSRNEIPVFMMIKARKI